LALDRLGLLIEDAEPQRERERERERERKERRRRNPRADPVLPPPSFFSLRLCASA
jgi:hypothetical protein